MADDTLKKIEQARKIDPEDRHRSEDNIARYYVGDEEVRDEGTTDIRDRFFRDRTQDMTSQVRQQNQQIIGTAADTVTQLYNADPNSICTKDPKTLSGALNLTPQQLETFAVIDDNLLYSDQKGSLGLRWGYGLLNNPLDISMRNEAAKRDRDAMEEVHDLAVLGARDTRCKQTGLEAPAPARTEITVPGERDGGKEALLKEGGIYVENLNATVDASTHNHYHAAPATPRRASTGSGKSSTPKTTTPAVTCGDNSVCGNVLGNNSAIVNAAASLKNTQIVDVDSTAPQEGRQLTGMEQQRTTEVTPP